MEKANQELIHGSIHTKANIYFDGRVISHTVTGDGDKKTIGVILPGEYKFNTAAPEIMIITSGACRVLIGNGHLGTYEAGDAFEIPADSFFTISVDRDTCEYVCVLKGRK